MLRSRLWVQDTPQAEVLAAKTMFLAADALRGVGVCVFDTHGIRFAYDLGRRDCVTADMWKSTLQSVLARPVSSRIVASVQFQL